MIPLVGAATFAALLWGTLALVVVTFLALLYGVVRAGGVALTET